MAADRIELTWAEVLEKLVQRAAPWATQTREQKTAYVKACKRNYVNKTTRDRVLMTWNRLAQPVMATADALEDHYRRYVAQSKAAPTREEKHQQRARTAANKTADKISQLDRKEQVAAVEELFEPLTKAIRKLEAPAIPGFLSKAHQLMQDIVDPVEDWLFEEISEAMAQLNQDLTILARLQKAAEEVNR